MAIIKGYTAISRLLQHNSASEIPRWYFVARQCCSAHSEFLLSASAAIGSALLSSDPCEKIAISIFQ